MNIYEEDGNGNYINMGVIYCGLCFKYIENSINISDNENYENICDKCQDKINIDDKYHNETNNLGLFKPTKFKFIEILK